ncbi:hypothetical protein JOF29_007951 [Kribbella aluminosa]|uniref:Phage tail tape measure protein n=1 Tax=Kribbella aluminosa TaxID=416017 RepID=A0ABS4UYY8_9ACTN|nr:hypothetical protein [Kribbella aluminosa]MBP2356841.1 hypothetical protein [Kribbella aluminosa]
MASEDLTFDVIARDHASGVLLRIAAATRGQAAALSASTRATAEAAGISAKLQAARDREADVVGRVQVAEQRLAEVRANGSAKASQVVRAEQALAKVRRDAERAATAVTRVEESENDGGKSGRGWVRGFLHWMGVGTKDIVQSAKDAASAAGGGFWSGFQGVLKTPLIGPAVIAGLAATVAALLVPVGALAAGAVVLGFGSGLAALGLVFAAKADGVKAAWKSTLSDMGDQMTELSTPFQRTLILMASVARSTFAGLKPELAAAFATLAPSVLDFGTKLAEGVARLGQSFRPLSAAFAALLGQLGPGLSDMLGSLSLGLSKLSVSVAKNPGAIADLVRGVGALTGDLLSLVGILNDTDGAFRRLTGIGSVTVLMAALRTVVFTTIGPFVGLAAAAGAVMDTLSRWMKPVGAGFHYTATTATEAATATKYWTQGLSNAQLAAMGITLSAHQTSAAVADVTAQIARQTAATNALIAALHRLSGTALSERDAQIAYAQAVADATKAAQTNGKALSLNSQAGRDNQKALDAVAAAANVVTDSMLHANSGTAAAAAAAARSQAAFVVLAEKMGYSAGQAAALARQLIDIPNVTRTISIVTQYSSTGVNLTNPSAVGGNHQLIIPKGQHRAGGGSVTAGTPYLVGEKGAELFVPKVSGAILTHQQTAAKQAAHYKELQKLDLFVNGSFAQGLMGSANHIGVVFNELMTKVLGLNLPRPKESRIVAYLRAEDKLLTAETNRRAAIAVQLKAAQQKLADLVAARNQYAQQITSSALSFTSITGAQADANGNLTAQSVIAQMTEKVRKVQQFATDLAALRKRGLNLTTYQDIVGAGVDQGDQIAKALLGGNVNTFNQVNRLQANATSTDVGLGNSAANALYGSGIRAQQVQVNQITVNGAMDANATAKQIQQMLLALKRRSGGVSLGIA